MNTNPIPKTGADVFASPFNIQMGRGRVMWGEATTDMSGKFHPSGWVLPGGRRTVSPQHAEAVAQRINELSK